MNIPATTPLFNGEPITMSSREIAELVESRHDSVKRAVERLAEKGVIIQPPTVDEQDTDAMGRSRTTSVYHLEKRDSFVVVAQLSPEFTARVVDRWQELEEEKATGGFRIPQTLGDALQLAADQARQIEVMRDDVSAFEKLAKADGSLTTTEAAKNLGMRPKDLFQWMSSNGWIYKRPGAAAWLGYQTRCNAGDLEHKTTTVLRADGSERITEQVRITAQGLTKLVKLIPPAVREVA